MTSDTTAWVAVLAAATETNARQSEGFKELANSTV